MPNSKPKEAKGSVVYSILGAIVPGCGPALRMVELGQQRRLKLHERFILLYNTPLCPHCNCNRDKFRREREKMRAVAKENRGRNA